MEIRAISNEELMTATWLHRYAFGGWCDEPKEHESKWLEDKDTLGLFEDGQLQSAVTLIPFLQSIRGTLKGMSGVGAVASYPEARRRGMVRELFKASFALMHERGMPLTMLSAFKRSFYAQFGYVTANTSPFLKTSMSNLRSATAIKTDPELRIERVRAAEFKNLYLDFVRDVCAPKYHGYVLPEHLSDGDWRYGRKDSILALVKRGDRIEGLMRYRLKGQPLELPDDDEQSMTVHEIYWRNLPARDALLHFLGQHAEQADRILLYVPYGEKFEQWFPDANWQLLMWQAWMVRVVDVVDALTGLPTNQTGSTVISVSDDYCPWNRGNYKVSGLDGALAVKRTTQAAHVDLSIEGVSALAYGTVPLDEVEHRGWATCNRTADRQLLDAWFPSLPLHNAFSF